MDKHYRLIPTLDTAKLGSSFYLFDRRSDNSEILFVPTQKISPQLSSLIQKIRDNFIATGVFTIAEITECFPSAADKKRLNSLLSSGYIEENGPQPDTLQSPLTTKENESLTQAQYTTYFQQRVLKHFLRKKTFFNLPDDIDDKEVDVALIGFPLATVPESSGTVYGPDRLREYSQRAGFWFDFYRNGIYTEVGCDNTPAKLICRNVVVKDMGNIDTDIRTVGDIFSRAEALINEKLLPNNIRPIFIGGDHAISFPLVSAYLRRYPTLTLIHLDAHNDIFYMPYVDLNHACPVLGLLMHSNLTSVFSFGLRTNADPRSSNFHRFSKTKINEQPAPDRLHLHSLNSTRRRLANPESFAEYLIENIGADTPCYLTIDLDVLSENTIKGQLSTPAGHGLEYQELYEFIEIVSQSLNVIAADVVEFSVGGNIGQEKSQRELTVLNMILIEGLHQSAQRNPSLPVASNDAPTSYSDSNENFGNVVAKEQNSKILLPQLAPRIEPPQIGLKVESIERVSADKISYSEFIESFVLPGRPLVLTNFDESTAVSHWSFDYFTKRLAHDLQIQLNVYHGSFAHQNIEPCAVNLVDALRLINSRSTYSAHKTPKAGDAAKGAESILDSNANRDIERYNIVDWAYRTTNSELAEDLPDLPFFSMDISQQLGHSADSLKWIYFGEPGTGTDTHIDAFNSTAWLLLAQGTKKWRMVHASDAERCRYQHRWADLFNPDARFYPSMNGLRVWETTQEAGQIVWTPSRCVHAVRNVGYCIAATHNYIDLTNLPEVHHAISQLKPFGTIDNKQVHHDITFECMHAYARKEMDRPGFGGAYPLLKPNIDAYREQLSERISQLQGELITRR